MNVKDLAMLQDLGAALATLELHLEDTTEAQKLALAKAAIEDLASHVAGAISDTRSEFAAIDPAADTAAYLKLAELYARRCDLIESNYEGEAYLSARKLYASYLRVYRAGEVA